MKIADWLLHNESFGYFLNTSLRNLTSDILMKKNINYIPKFLNNAYVHL